MRNVAAAASLLLLISCGTGDLSADDGQQSPEDLWGRTYVSVSVTEDGEPRPLAPGTRIEVTFEEREDEGVVRWKAGCNIHGASVEITPESLHVGEISATAMGCSEELLDQDEWLADVFGSDPRWELVEDRLTLASGGTVIELEASRD